MEHQSFHRLVGEALDSLPAKFRQKIENVAVVVEDYPAGHESMGRAQEASEGLLMGEFQGTPATQKSVWDSGSGPDRIVLYQKNIEAVCKTEEEIREEVRLTVLHELGHYFGMSEDQLEEV